MKGAIRVLTALVILLAGTGCESIGGTNTPQATSTPQPTSTPAVLQLQPGV